MLRHTISRTLAIAGVTLALGVQGVAAETVLKLGTVGRLGMPIGDAIDQAMIPKAAELSGGNVVVEPHYRGSLCGEQKCGEQANQGLLQLWTSSTANFGNFGTALAIFDLPYIFKSIEDADAISEGWMSDAQCQVAAETTGHICFVVYSSGGFRELGNAERPVHKPDDMKGLKWRVTKSPIEYTLIKSWGAVPVPYDWTQLYQGLQTGVVSGQYVAIPWQYIAKLHEVAQYYTQIGGAWSGNQIAMDVAQYNALSPEEKEWGRRRGRRVRQHGARARPEMGGGRHHGDQAGNQGVVRPRPTRRCPCGAPVRSAHGRTPRAPSIRSLPSARSRRAGP